MRKLILFISLLIPLFGIAQTNLPKPDSTQLSSPPVIGAFTPSSWYFRGGNASNGEVGFFNTITRKWITLTTGYQAKNYLTQKADSNKAHGYVGWEYFLSHSGGSNIYNVDGSLTGDRTLDLSGHFLLLGTGNPDAGGSMALTSNAAGLSIYDSTLGVGSVTTEANYFVVNTTDGVSGNTRSFELRTNGKNVLSDGYQHGFQYANHYGDITNGLHLPDQLSVDSTAKAKADSVKGTISGGVNIYNSDGVLTGNRTLDALTNQLNLQGEDATSQWSISANSNTGSPSISLNTAITLTGEGGLLETNYAGIETSYLNSTGKKSALFIDNIEGPEIADQIRKRGLHGNIYFGTGYADGKTYLQKFAIDSISKAKADSVKATISTGGITALTGEATASGPGSSAVILTNSAVIGKVLTGYTSGAGTVSATDNILQAIQKLNGNIGALTTGVSSVVGTTNRLTSSPTSGNVVLDISASYAGQSSINTLGTIGTGVWQGTAIGDTYISSAATWNAKQSAITFGTSVQTALGVNIGSAGAPVLFNGAGGTPSSMVGTNFSGTGASFTAGKATILNTARTIAGTSFDGSANISLANKFIVQGTSDGGLSGAQFMGSLGTGIVKNATTTGVQSIAVAGTDFTSPTGTETLTNKRITPRIGTTASSSTPGPAGDSNDMFTVTALAANATFASPTGTPTDGQPLLIRIKDNGTARTLAWNSIYRASTDFALPTTTVISKTMYVQFIYNAADTKWDCTGLTNGF